MKQGQTTGTPQNTQQWQADTTDKHDNDPKITVAEFHKYIRSYGGDASGTPETALYAGDPTTKPSRRADMRFTEHGIECKQRFGTILVPYANVSFVKVV